jgi:hypothetical protein
MYAGTIYMYMYVHCTNVQYMYIIYYVHVDEIKVVMAIY